GRGLLERALDRLNDGRQGFLQRLEHLVGVEGEAARDALCEVATAYVHFANVVAGEGGTDFLLDALGSGLADEAAVVAAHIGHDGFVKTITTDADRLGIDDTIEG